MNPSLCLHRSLQFCPLPLSSLRFTFSSVLFIVFPHQGTYDLWAHLSAIIKQSLMKSRKVTSPCACIRVRVPVRLIFLRTHVQLQGLHKPRKLNGERSMTSSEMLDSGQRSQRDEADAEMDREVTRHQNGGCGGRRGFRCGGEELFDEKGTCSHSPSLHRTNKCRPHIPLGAGQPSGGRASLSAIWLTQ